MHALSQCLLATSISAVLALSTPARSLDRTSNIEWRTFTVQDFGTAVQYPANIFFPAGRPGKGTGQRFKSADGRADLSIYSLPNEAGETPATYLRHNLRMDRSALQYTRIAPHGGVFLFVTLARFFQLALRAGTAALKSSASST